MTSPMLTVRIQKAWAARFDHRLLECRRSVAELKRELMIYDPAVEVLAHDSQFAEKAEVLCLEASLLRADGNRDGAKALLAKVEGAVRVRQEPDFFSLALQKALTAYSEGNSARALEGFLAAQAAAPSGQAELVARLNALFCLENLGQDVDESVNESRARLQEIEKTEDVIPLVRIHLEAFSLRQEFRLGRWVPRALTGLETEFSTQRDYYIRWVQALPYVQPTPSGGAARESLPLPFLRRDTAYRVYRIRTLQGLDHPEDVGSVPVQEWADRFYLWVWKWLMDPAEFPAQRLGAVLGEWSALSTSVLTQEDAYLVRNAMGWLCLFDPSAEGRIQKWLQKIRPARMSLIPVLDFESRVQDVLRLWLRGESKTALKMVKLLKADPLAGEKGYRFGELLDALDATIMGRDEIAGPFEKLLHGLRDWTVAERQPRAGRLCVDLATGAIRAPNGDEMVSPGMAEAFGALMETPVLPHAEFVARVFGYSRYDSLIHDPKILNLLARMRDIAPKGLTFGVKSGRVRAEGEPSAWRQVQFLGRHPYVTGLKGVQEWQDFGRQQTAAKASAETVNSGGPGVRSTRPESAPILALKKLQGQGTVTRAQLEEATGVSRATAARMIAGWVEKGFVRREGSARNTRYTILLSADRA